MTPHPLGGAPPAGRPPAGLGVALRGLGGAVNAPAPKVIRAVARCAFWLGL